MQTNPKQNSFAHHGFVVLREFLTGEEVAIMKAAIESLLASPPDSMCSRPNNTLLPLRWNNRIVELALTSGQRMHALSDALCASDLKWILGYISIKEAHTPALWWHQDWWCWDHPVSFQPASSQVAVLCYLNATSIHNGALRILPGSHHRSSQIHAHLPQPATHGSVQIEPNHVAMTDHPNQLIFSAEAGDAIAVDYRLLHGTHPNNSDTRRDCIILNFAPSWRSLPPPIQSHLISHPALPSGDECPLPRSLISQVLPAFDGVPRDLPVNRIAPHQFEVASSSALAAENIPKK